MWPLWLTLLPAVFQPFIRCSLQCRDLVDEAKKFHLRPELRSQMQGPRTRARLGKLASWQREAYFLTTPCRVAWCSWKEHSIRNTKTCFRSVSNLLVRVSPWTSHFATLSSSINQRYLPYLFHVTIWRIKWNGVCKKHFLNCHILCKLLFYFKIFGVLWIRNYFRYQVVFFSCWMKRGRKSSSIV